MKYKLVIVALFLLNRSVFITKADTIPHNYIGFQCHYGFIIPHSESIRNVSHSKPYGVEISLSNLHTSFRDWQVFNAYWISGMEASYFNFQNPQVLGYAFSVSFFAEPVISHGEKYFITARGGGGFSYHSKIYDPVNNPLNLFFSSRISFPLYIAARFKYRISNRTFITLSCSYNHISNGGFKQPNKGMNFPTLALGLEYFNNLSPVLDENYSYRPAVTKPGMFFTIQALTTVSVKNKDAAFPQKTCFVYGFHIRISKPLGSKYAINAGAEIIGDGYIRETLRRNQMDMDYKRFAGTFGQDIMLGRVIFTQYFGIYLYAPYKARNPIYQKYELAYRFGNRVLAGVYLKAHAQVAESMGIIFNYRLQLNKSIK